MSFLTVAKRLLVVLPVYVFVAPAFGQTSCSAVFEAASRPAIVAPVPVDRAAADRRGGPRDPQIRKLFDELADPYSMAHFLVAEKGEAVARRELRDLDLILEQRSPSARLAELDRWVTSESHALILYHVLHARGLQSAGGMLEALLETNVYFVDAHPLRGPPTSLVTYSFEKEGHEGEISMLYKDPKFTDDQWLALGERERVDRLQGLTDQKRVFMPSSKIAPTSLHPEALSGYSEDIFIEKLKAHTWEIKHKGYEISPDRLMRQIRETTGLFRDTSAVHVHVVFEIDSNDRSGKQFGRWSKQMNDFLTLRGLEEGLHNNHRTRLQGRAGGLLRRVWDWVRHMGTQTTAPSDFKAIGARNYKFFSMGIRGDIYGPGSTPGRRKIGLELRDVTRDLGRLQADIAAVTKAVQDRAWGKFADQDPASDRGLSTDRGEAIRRLGRAVSPESAKLFRDVVETAALPLEEFETGLYVNLSTGRLEGVSPEASARIVAAREKYMRELQSLEKELRSFRERGEAVEPMEIEIALKMTLAEWASAARVSELFGRN